ncbi:hypothetical protein LP420_12945 [Massilia sp. B-10]|nr:hypothetical protein LP420_12945 [Massilia sp. B-10]
MPNMTVVERDYSQVYQKFTSIGPLLETLGNGGKGIGWKTGHEVDVLRGLNRTVTAAAWRRASRAWRPPSTRPK